MLSVSDKSVHITNPRILAFLTTYKDNEGLLELFEEQIESFCRAMTNFIAANDDCDPSDPEGLIGYLQDFEKRLCDSEEQRHAEAVNHGEKVMEKVNLQLATLMAGVENAIAKSTQNNDLAGLQANIKTSVAECMAAFHTETIKTSCEIKSTADAIHKKVDQISSARTHTSKAKGEASETVIFELLNNRLHPYEGYQIERVGGKERCCDIKVTKLNAPTVRFEIKNYGEFNGTRVPIAEVDKFRRDLMSTNDHGIFVSLHTGISGKGNLDFEFLPNRKIAAYVSSNKYEIETLTDVMFIIYKLDEVIKVQEDTDNFELSRQTVEQIQGFLKNFIDKMASAKAHIKQSLELLNSITFESIEGLILGTFDAGEAGSKIETRDKQHYCGICKEYFSSRQTPLNHREHGCPTIRREEKKIVRRETRKVSNTCQKKIDITPDEEALQQIASKLPDLHSGSSKQYLV